MSRLRWFAAALLCLSLGGCGIPTTGPISFGDAPRVAPSGEQLYFLLDGKLHPTLRPAVISPAVAGTLTSVGHLSEGPLPEERDAGLTSEVPAGLLGFLRGTTSDEVTSPALVFLTGPTAGSDPTSLSDAAAAQLACTITAALSLDGHPVNAVTLRDRSGHLRGPLICPLPLPGR
jgi:predicted small lipoprotein YifL